MDQPGRGENGHSESTWERLRHHSAINLGEVEMPIGINLGRDGVLFAINLGQVRGGPSESTWEGFGE